MKLKDNGGVGPVENTHWLLNPSRHQGRQVNMHEAVMVSVQLQVAFAADANVPRLVMRVSNHTGAAVSMQMHTHRDSSRSDREI